MLSSQSSDHVRTCVWEHAELPSKVVVFEHNVREVRAVDTVLAALTVTRQADAPKCQQERERGREREGEDSV